MILNASDILSASILIVDDQDANVKLLERLLGEAGYTNVASTMNPQDVAALHRKNHHDLILLDLQMPGMDGQIVIDRTRRRRSCPDRSPGPLWGSSARQQGRSVSSV